jgi:hypothetical protein
MAKEKGPTRAYLNTATGAIRKSSSTLGFPFVEMTDAEADAANIGGVRPTAKPDQLGADEKAEGPKSKAKG